MATTQYNPEDAQPLIGESPAFLELMEHVSKVAPLDKPALVIGERGTGKELIASRLHYLSGRWDQPLIKLNCASLTETLLENELFGHEAGAYTGATKRHIGRFERANNGTLFLDELANIPLRVQEKILRTVEYGEFERVGGSETVSTDVRLIGATNADLPTLVAEGRFRADLLDRLAFDVITIPPLRARPLDILKLAEHFALGITRELRREYFAGFSPDAQLALQNYHWPGNVRELRNVVERSVYRCHKSDAPIATIIFDAFDSPYRLSTDTAAQPPAPKKRPVATAPLSGKPALPTDLKQLLQQLEKDLLQQAMAEAQYNQKAAARLLGLTYHQLRAALQRHAMLPGKRK